MVVVEAFTAGALPVTAVAAARWLKAPLSRGEWVGVAGVVVGLVMRGLSAGAGQDVALTGWQQWLSLGMAVLLLALTVAGARVPGRLGATMLGALARFGFVLVAVATRTLGGSFAVGSLLTDLSA